MPSESDYMMRFRKAEQSVCRAMAALDPDAVNVALVTELVIWFQRCGGLAGALQAVGAVGANSSDNRGEAVLVFLPGTKEIEDVKEALLRTELGRDAEQREWVLALHGGLAAEEQKRVFLRPPKGVFKVADADVC